MELESKGKKIKRYAIAASFFVVAFLLFLLRGTTGYGGLATTLLKIYVIASCTILILAVLMQSGKGGGLAAIGGLGGDSLLGSRSATPLAKATYVLGSLFIFICVLLARQPILRRRGSGC